MNSTQQEITCIQGKKALIVCITKNCKNNAFTCETTKCKCQQLHRKCIKDITLKKLLMNIREKKPSTNNDQQIVQIQTIFKQINTQIQNQYNEFKKFIQKLKNCNMGTQFLKKISNSNKKQLKNIDGEYANSVYQSTINDQQKQISIRKTTQQKTLIFKKLQELRNLISRLYLIQEQKSIIDQKNDENTSKLQQQEDRRKGDAKRKRRGQNRNQNQERQKFERAQQQKKKQQQHKQLQLRIQKDRQRQRQKQRQKLQKERQLRQKRQKQAKELQKRQIRYQNNKINRRQEEQRKQQQPRLDHRQAKDNKNQQKKENPRYVQQLNHGNRNNQKKNKIKDIEPGDRHLNLIVKIILVEKNSYKGKGKPYINCLIGDQTGVCNARFELTDLIKVDNEIQIINGFVRIYKGHIQIECGKYGRIEVAKNKILKIGMGNNISAKLFVEVKQNNQSEQV